MIKHLKIIINYLSVNLLIITANLPNVDKPNAKILNITQILNANLHFLIVNAPQMVYNVFKGNNVKMQ